MAGISAAIFTVLGWPVLVELGIVLISTKLIRDHVLGKDDLLNFIKSKMAGLPASAQVSESMSSNYAKVYATLARLALTDKKALNEG